MFSECLHCARLEMLPVINEVTYLQRICRIPLNPSLTPPCNVPLPLLSIVVESTSLPPWIWLALSLAWGIEGRGIMCDIKSQEYTSRGPGQELSPSRDVAVKWGSSSVFLFSPILYFWQHWDLVAVRGLSLVVVRRATLCCSVWASACGGFCYGAQALGTSGLW